MTSRALVQNLLTDRLVSRIWARDPGPFLGTGAPPAAVLDRLGWLAAPEAAANAARNVSAFAEDARSDGLTDAVLLGMGGSSLCAEVLRDVPSPRRWSADLTVLDTTDERAVRAAADALVPARTLFIVASKSGTTVEVDALENLFWARMSDALGPLAGRHFVAITDPETPLAALAAARGYRRTFINAPDIGGRYSALSLFGLVPAALLGIELEPPIAAASHLAAACRSEDADNPGLALGAFLASGAQAGRDKLTLVLADDLAPLGVWIEQLVAESTGKHGRGILPVVGEPVGLPGAYGPDRMFVASEGMDTSFAAGAPVFVLPRAGSPGELGAEFFRWEFATAVAGAALGINPFDEPDVRDAKRRTQGQLDARRQSGAFTIDPPFLTRNGIQQRARERRGTPVGAGREFVAMLDYLPADERRAERLAAVRTAIRARTGLATTYGVGPRYLHSTGQYHKGGPNTGIFAILTADDAIDTSIPGRDYTFSVLKHAQALGDFEALAAAGRRVSHWHLAASDDHTATIERILARWPANG